jgi:hypothetical protein
MPAQSQNDLSRNDGNILATDKAPNTTAVGQTKPPSRDASPTSVTVIDRPTPRQAADDAVASRICIGCKPDPSTTGALPPAAPDRDAVKLDELRTMAAPSQQSDLNTVDLASAHREKARSMEDKTDGLWQSWLVSVCDGCGDQKPVRSLRYEEWPDRHAPLTTGSLGKAPNGASARPPHKSLEADLSPDNVDSIRRMPPR